MVWLLAALGNSIFAAGNAEINRYYKQEAFRLNMWRTLLASLVWFPLALLEDWPYDPLFYSTAVLGGLVVLIGNVVLNDLAAKHNGRVAVLHIPLKAVIVFAVWPLIDDGAWEHITNEQPWQLLVGGIFFGIMVLAMNSMRRNDASWGALKMLAPVILLYSLSDILARLELPADELQSRLVIYLFIMMSVSGVFSLLILPWRPKPELPVLNKRLLQAAGWAALVSVLNHVCFFIALSTAPSPAYVSMIALLAPAWLFVYHRMAGIADNASPWASMVLVLGSIGLLLVMR